MQEAHQGHGRPRRHRRPARTRSTRELVTEAQSFVAGFRPGKAPRKIVERFYKDDVEHQVRGEVLMASLEQLAEEQDIAPLAPPDLDPAKIDHSRRRAADLRVRRRGPAAVRLAQLQGPQAQAADPDVHRRRRATRRNADCWNRTANSCRRKANRRRVEVGDHHHLRHHDRATATGCSTS